MPLARMARVFVTFALLAFVQVSGLIDPAWLVEIEADCIVE